MQTLRIFPSSPPEPCFAPYQRKQFLVAFGLEAMRAETQNLKANPESPAWLWKSPEVHIAFPGTVRAQENSAHKDRQGVYASPSPAQTLAMEQSRQSRSPFQSSWDHGQTPTCKPWNCARWDKVPLPSLSFFLFSFFPFPFFFFILF